MNTDFNNQPTTPLQQKRPAFVWVIFFFYWIGLFITVALSITGVVLKSKGMTFPPVDSVDRALGFMSLALRGVATMRLFYLKKDAWLWFASAVSIVFTLMIMNCISAVLLNKEPFASIFTTLLTISFWSYVTWYSYKICNIPQPNPPKR